MSRHPYYPNVLVACEEVAELLDSGARPIQVDIDKAAYSHGHLPGAISWDWESQLRNPETHDILSRQEYEGLMGSSGLTPHTPVILYGDNNNWFACWAFWLMSLYGHKHAYLLDGGLRKWMQDGHDVSVRPTGIRPTSYEAREADLSCKATTEDIFTSFFHPDSHRLVDVRSAAEYQGSIMSPGVGTEAKCARPGHIPTAINVPWDLNCNLDGTFKSPNELRKLYESFDIRPDNAVITYCAIGERASLSWFVLRHLLRFPVVMNFDRSMAYWTRLANAPIQLGTAAA